VSEHNETRGTIGEFKDSWPNRNPYNKAWFQRLACKRWMDARRWRLVEIDRRWSDRFFEAGMTAPVRLCRLWGDAEKLKLKTESGLCDWRAFPEWVQKARAK